MDRQEEHRLKLEALRRDIAAGMVSLAEGRVSHAKPADIKAAVAVLRASRRAN